MVAEAHAENIVMGVEQTRGSGTWSLTSPRYRILDSSRVLVAGFGWAAASWDSTLLEISALFDSALVGLTAVGIYYVQFDAVIGTDRPFGEVTVRVHEVGP
jgi:hypothetical protein